MVAVSAEAERKVTAAGGIAGGAAVAFLPQPVRARARKLENRKRSGRMTKKENGRSGGRQMKAVGKSSSG
jgi:hypothetical protein